MGKLHTAGVEIARAEKEWPKLRVLRKDPSGSVAHIADRINPI